MEFSQKLYQLRTARGLTQEQLASQLFVSRTAVSKWESGRGCPSIDSLKAIAAFFSVTVDELLSGEELLNFAEKSVIEKEKRYTVLICGVLDCFYLLLLFLPFFRQTVSGEIQSVSLLNLHFLQPWLKICYLLLTVLTVVNGFAALIIENFEKPTWSRHRLITGFTLSVLTALLFILSRQPYPGAFAFCCLVCKGYFLLKSK